MKAVAALTLTVLLCACGQKGPLYFAPAPEPDAAAEQAAPAPAQENNDDTQD